MNFNLAPSILVQVDNSGLLVHVFLDLVFTSAKQTLPLEETMYLGLNYVIFPRRFAWLDDCTLVACCIPPSRGPPPKKPLVPAGPNIQSNETKEVVQNRTYQDLLKDQHDEDLFDHYGTSQLFLINLNGETEPIGKPAVYTSIDPSPDGSYFLVSTTHRPYSFIVPSGRFPKRMELWKRTGEFVREICSLPLAENIPITFNSVRQGRRSINWRADKPACLYW